MSYSSSDSNIYLSRNNAINTNSISSPPYDIDIGEVIQMGRSGFNSILFNGWVANIRVSDSVLYIDAYTVPDPTTWSEDDVGTVMYEDFSPPPLILSSFPI